MRFVEQQVRLVKEEHQLGLFQVAHLGQALKHFREHPQQEGGVQARRVEQLVGRQHIDHAVALAIGLHEVVNVEHGLAKELRAPLAFQLKQSARNRPHTGRADIAVAGGVVLGVLAHVLEHGPQVFEVEQQQALVVSDLEDQIQNAGLGFVEAEHAAQQQRPHVGDSGPHRMALFSKDVPQLGGTGLRRGQTHAALGQHSFELVAGLARLADAGQVALDVSHEHGHPQARELFGQGLQGDRLASTGGAGDQTVAVGQLGQQQALGLFVLGNQQRFGHGRVPSGRGSA
jgi:hypothetical protein